MSLSSKSIMKYIRYLLYSILLGVLFGGSYGILSFLRLNNTLSFTIPWQGIFYIGVFFSIPYIAGIEKEIKYKGKKIEGITSNYIENESEYIWEYGAQWKDVIVEVINGIIYNNQVFCLEYKEKDYIRYVSEKMEDNLIKSSKRKASINRIIIEIEKEEGGKVRMAVHKDNQYMELSNKDNEEVLTKIVIGLMKHGSKLTKAST